MVYNTILDAIGNTPMIKLQRLADPDSAEILVKFEGLNVGGSIKTRTALNMIEDAEKKGLLSPNTIIVEPTSGNQGIGLSLVGAVKGYKVKIIMRIRETDKGSRIRERIADLMLLLQEYDDGKIK